MFLRVWAKYFALGPPRVYEGRRYAGEGSGTRLITALLSRWKQLGNPPLPPVLPVVIAAVAFVILLVGISFVIMVL